MPNVKAETVETLRGIATARPSVIESLLGMEIDNLEDSGLDPRAYALVRLATLIALDAPPASYRAPVDFALAAGVSAEEITGVLIAAAPQVGIPRCVAIAPELMIAMGVSVEEDPGR
jgi:4-carboxymuconolactone decarboxylase